jgi:hypothetical protein
MMRWLGASGDLGPGVILTAAEISEAIEMGLERTEYYRQHLGRTNGQPVERLGADNDRGAVAEYGAREFWDLPHDGPERVGQPDLGRMTDVKSIRRIGHRLMIPATQFHSGRRYLVVFADVETGEVRIQGGASGTWIWDHQKTTYNPTGRDSRATGPRPCWEVSPEDFEIQPGDVPYLEDKDL